MCTPMIQHTDVKCNSSIMINIGWKHKWSLIGAVNDSQPKSKMFTLIRTWCQCGTFSRGAPGSLAHWELKWGLRPKVSPHSPPRKHFSFCWQSPSLWLCSSDMLIKHLLERKKERKTLFYTVCQFLRSKYSCVSQFQTTNMMSLYGKRWK